LLFFKNTTVLFTHKMGLSFCKDIGNSYNLVLGIFLKSKQDIGGLVFIAADFMGLFNHKSAAAILFSDIAREKVRRVFCGSIGGQVNQKTQKNNHF